MNNEQESGHSSIGLKASMILGLFGGMVKFIYIDNYILQAPHFSTKFIEALVTAIGCALAGAFAKHMYDRVIKPRIDNLFKSK